MRKIREVLRLKFDCGLSVRKISRSLGIGHSSAGDYLCRFAASGLAWPCSLSDSELEQQLFPPAQAVPSEQRPLPDWSWVHAELRRPGVTLALLWQEYRLNQPQGFQYSWFCEHYRAWQGKLHIDYHVEVDGHYYSVPYQLVKKQLEVRLTARTVECFHANQRVASHLRSPHKGRHSTQTEHMPKSHREHAEWTPQRLIRWAEQTGPNTVGVISHILERRIHPTHGYRACLGILRLGKTHGEVRLELACRRALSLGACSYKSLESILRQGLENLPLAQANLPLLPDDHANLRGPGYYH